MALVEEARLARLMDTAPDEDVADLCETVRALVEALEEISDPLGHLRRTLTKGSTFDPHMALEFAKQPSTYQEIARKALEKLK